MNNPTFERTRARVQKITRMESHGGQTAAKTEHDVQLNSKTALHPTSHLILLNLKLKLIEFASP